MKKVCMITTVHSFDDVRIYHKEAKSLVKAGYDVIIINPVHSGTDEYGVKFYKINVPKKRVDRVIKSWKIALKAAREIKADIYHLHDPELLPTAMSLKRKGKNVIYDAHEDTPRQILNKDWISASYRGFIAKIFEKYENSCAKKVDVVIAATQTIADRFGNSVVIHNYPRQDEFDADNTITPYLKRKNAICYIGSITNSRGITQTMNAIENLDLSFNLAGSYETLEFKNDIEKMPAFQKVDYKGYLDRKSTMEVLNESKIGILVLQPTICYKDSLPIKLFEYMLAGLPIVASDFKLWKELFGTAAMLYVDPTNYKEIENAIDFLLKNPDRAKNMGEAGRDLVLKKFTFEAEERKLLKCYKNILSE